jgi:hypothetical protein
MKQQQEETNNSWYYILAVIFGILTALVTTGSIAWALFGAILGLLMALFYVNVLVEKREV